MPHPTLRYLIWLALLLAIIVVVIGIMALLPSSVRKAAPASYTPPPPAPTKQDVVTAQKGFQYLVSHTSNGFSPASLTVKRGETVRFSNSTPSSLSLTFSNAAPQTVVPGGYYEYTYTAPGSFAYSDGKRSGTVTVK